MKSAIAVLAAASLAFVLVAPRVQAQGNGRADQAVRAYAQARAAEDLADRNSRAAARWQALAHAPGSPVLGDSAAANTIVVFFDYACPYCRAAEPRLLALARGGRAVRVVMKEFPILTPQSLAAARMALAAARQNRYWDFHNGLMRMPGQLNLGDMEALARGLKLDMARLRRDMQGPEVNDEIIANFNLARGIRAFQTPTYVVNRRVLTADSDTIDFARELQAR